MDQTTEQMQPIQEKKSRWWSWLLIVIILIAVGIGAYFFLIRGSQIPIPPPLPE